MKRLPLTFLLMPAIVLAQASFPTEFPAGAVALEPEMLRQRLAGKSFNVKPAAGPEYRIQYKGEYAYLNVYHVRRPINCAGPWRVEGSLACMNWKDDQGGCSEFRLASDVLYRKVPGSGEVVAMLPN
jgi:hypothetical protein